MSEIEVKVRTIGDEGFEVYAFSQGAQINHLLEELDFNPETVVVKRNGKMVPEEEGMEEGDEIVVIPVVSGG